MLDRLPWMRLQMMLSIRLDRGRWHFGDGHISHKTLPPGTNFSAYDVSVNFFRSFRLDVYRAMAAFWCLRIYLANFVSRTQDHLVANYCDVISNVV